MKDLEKLENEKLARVREVEASLENAKLAEAGARRLAAETEAQSLIARRIVEEARKRAEEVRGCVHMCTVYMEHARVHVEVVPTHANVTPLLWTRSHCNRHCRTRSHRHRSLPLTATPPIRPAHPPCTTLHYGYLQTELRAKLRLKEVGDLKTAALRGRNAATGRADDRGGTSLKGLGCVLAVFVGILAVALGCLYAWLMRELEVELEEQRNRVTY